MGSRVGVLLVGIGNYLYFSAPGGSLGWLLLVLYAAWIGQYLGDQALGGYLSGFVGAIVTTRSPHFLGAVGSMVAIGLGVLCGYPLYRSMARTLGWLQELGSG